MGGRSPIQKKINTQNKSQCVSTQDPPCTEKKPRGTTKEVHIEEEQTKTQEISMEEEIGYDIGMDTQMLEAYEPSDAQRKRTWEEASGSRKKAKAKRKPL